MDSLQVNNASEKNLETVEQSSTWRPGLYSLIDQMYLALIMFKKAVLIIFLLKLTASIQGQTLGELKVIGFDCHTDLPVQFPSKIKEDSLNQSLNWWRANMIQNGYLAASIDSIRTKEDSVQIFCYPGRKFIIRSITSDTGHLIGEFISEWNSDQKDTRNRAPWQVIDEVKLQLGKQGYHQSQVDWQPIFQSDSTFDIHLSVDRGQLLRYGKILQRGQQVVHDAFLRSHLFWKEGEIVSNTSIRNIKRRMSSLPYIQLTGEPEWALEYDRANLLLDVAKRKSNLFDFILGVLPAADNQDRNLILSVYLNAVFYNQMKWGERLAVKFINTKPNTQELNLDLAVPNLFSSPFGAIGGLQLYRDEEAHLDLKYRLGGNYSTKNNFSLGVEWERFASSVLNVDTSFLISENRLPEDLDFVTQRLKMSFAWMNLDNVLSPRQGLHMVINGSLGQKQISVNTTLADYKDRGFQIEEMYDDLGRNQAQFNLVYDLKFYKSFGQRWGVVYSSRGGHLFSEGSTVENELYRVGGNELMRGFDEQFFLVNHYWVQTVEGRFFLGPNSFLSAFWDVGFLERNTNFTQFSGWVNGPGMGLNFQTEVGIFNLSYAIGSGLGFTFDTSAGKVHFGYVSLF